MKIGTRQYAKRQISWIRNKLLPVVEAANAISRASDRSAVAPTYLLDATVLGAAWNTHVREIAERVTQDFIGGQELPDPLSLSDAARTMLTILNRPTDPTAVLQARRKVTCPICTFNPEQPVMLEEGREWAAHVGTRTHRRLSRKATKCQNGQHRAVRHNSRERVDAVNEQWDMAGLTSAVDT